MLLLIRAILIWLEELLAQNSASAVKCDLRQMLLHHIFLLGPTYTRGESSGELVHTLVEGVESLDNYITQYLPAKVLAALVPALVFIAVLILDPWTTLVYIVAGPMLLLLLALIGGQTKAIQQRRFREMSWMSASFLDMLQGLPTLKMFGRSREQAQNIREISRHYGKTTMEVLRTAFQTSLVLEWSATAATALVALEVSLRLMNGLLPFNIALAVLLLTPEFFLPLRRYAERFISHTATFRILTYLRTWFYTAIEPLTPARLQQLRSGDLLSRIMADIETLENFYIRVIIPPLAAALVTLFATLLLGSFNIWLGLALLFFLLLTGLVLPLVTRWLSRNPAAQMIASRAELDATLVDGVQGIANMLSFGQDERYQEQVAALNYKLHQAQERLAIIRGTSSALVALFTSLAALTVLWLAIPLT